MILSGILHSTLGGFTVIRGVAPLGELARCSRFDPAYQRNLIETHRDEIEQFLADRQFLFFPEVVLSASLQFDFDKARGRAVDPLGDIFSGKGFTSNINGLKITVQHPKLPKAMETVGGANAPTLVYLDLPEEFLATDDDIKLFRIDGNHRLSAVSETKPGEANYGLETPFCVVLHQDRLLARQFEKVVFHNINAKQIPLTSEENLRLILEDGPEALFRDNALLENPSFGPAYLLARKLLPDLDGKFLTGLTKHLENRYTLALGLTQYLSTKDAALAAVASTEDVDAQIPRLRDAIKRANAMYEQSPHAQLRDAACLGVLTATVHFALKEEGVQLPAFALWMRNNRIDRLKPTGTTKGLGYHYHLGQTQAIDASSLVEVFESIQTARSREVFVSMEFGDHTSAVYKAIEEAIGKTNATHELEALDLALKPVRIDRVSKGHSFTIDSEILRIIDGSGLLIADLTQGNKNVYHEVGFMMGLNKGRGGEQDNFILIADQSKLQGDSDIGFNLRAWQQLRFNDTLDLVAKLVDALENYYKLK
ncbi:hypothetical protein [Novosphingobium mangrovi (ex Huang et al. 2023)]|uniref:DGQHR domain-containing protein n=1 Tax=Novosphingobium mangrovi (ex Huang et al. 2023) TaxID=2976432 RepID=A0ABT2I715_9SPHN|nr:hypothetical protein [Novosphingobium mangrovi (ex Huang et al. 2023)]MCT2400596.1 hypothetical protein [Novosphingobium mangrovi (ex Huang et al. 2023)]